MPTSDLDLPLTPSAEQIRHRTFATVRRGFDPDQVQVYLQAIATQVETLEKDLKEARLKADTAAAQAPAPMPAAPTEDPYDRISKRFSGLIATADREASRIVEEAMTEADRIRVDAQANAERDKQEGSEALESAREEADRILAGLAARRDLLVGQLQEMQARLLSVAKDLEVSIEAPRGRGTHEHRPGIQMAPPSDPVTEAAADAEPHDDNESQADAGNRADAEPAAASPGRLDEPAESREDDLWVSAQPDAPAIEADVGLDDLFADAKPSSGGDDEDGAIDIPDLASIELDFDEDRPASE
jgi:DivIVA domain-containing protein